MIQIAILMAALACQPAPAKDPPIDWTVPNSETPARKPAVVMPASPSADVGVLGFPKTSPQTGDDFLRSQAETSPPPPAPSPSVADLFRERNAREAAARAATEREQSPPPDGQYGCRRTATMISCGTTEAARRRAEEAAKAQLDQLMAPN